MSTFRPAFNTIPRGSNIYVNDNNNPFPAFQNILATATEGIAGLVDLQQRRALRQEEFDSRQKRLRYNSLLPDIATYNQNYALAETEEERKAIGAELDNYLSKYIGNNTLDPEDEAVLIDLVTKRKTGELEREATMLAAHEDILQAQQKEKFVTQKTALRDLAAATKRSIGTDGFTSKVEQFYKAYDQIAKQESLTATEREELAVIRRTVEENQWNAIDEYNTNAERLRIGQAKATISTLTTVLGSRPDVLQELAQFTNPAERYSATAELMNSQISTFLEQNYPNDAEEILRSLTNSPEMMGEINRAINTIYSSATDELNKLNDQRLDAQREFVLNQLLASGLSNPNSLINDVNTLLINGTTLDTIENELQEQARVLADNITQNEALNTQQKINALSRLEEQVRAAQSGVLNATGENYIPSSVPNIIRNARQGITETFETLGTFEQIADRANLRTVPAAALPGAVNSVIRDAFTGPLPIDNNSFSRYVRDRFNTESEKDLRLGFMLLAAAPPAASSVVYANMSAEERFAAQVLLPEMLNMQRTGMAANTNVREAYLQMKNRYRQYNAIYASREVNDELRLDRRLTKLTTKAGLSVFIPPSTVSDRERFGEQIAASPEIISTLSIYLSQVVKGNPDVDIETYVPTAEDYRLAKSLMQSDGFYLKESNGLPQLVYDPYGHTLQAAKSIIPTWDTIPDEELEQSLFQLSDKQTLTTIAERIGVDTQQKGYGDTLEDLLFNVWIEQTNAFAMADRIRPFVKFDIETSLYSSADGYLTTPNGGFLVRPTYNGVGDIDDEALERLLSSPYITTTTGLPLTLSFSRDLAEGVVRQTTSPVKTSSNKKDDPPLTGLWFVRKLFAGGAF